MDAQPRIWLGFALEYFTSANIVIEAIVIRIIECLDFVHHPIFKIYHFGK
jgi:hypothetical protein